MLVLFQTPVTHTNAVNSDWKATNPSLNKITTRSRQMKSSVRSTELPHGCYDVAVTHSKSGDNGNGNGSAASGLWLLCKTVDIKLVTKFGFVKSRVQNFEDLY